MYRKIKNVVHNLSVAVAALAATAVCATPPPPFSGVIVEGALGSSTLKSGGPAAVSMVTGEGAGADPRRGLVTTVGDVYLDEEKKKTNFSGRLGVGYGYTFPNININLTGLVTYNIGQNELKSNINSLSGEAVQFGAPLL